MKFLPLFCVLSLSFVGTLSFSGCKKKPVLRKYVELVTVLSPKNWLNIPVQFSVETRCKAGYTKNYGDEKRTCFFGKWSGTSLSCYKDTTCPDPGVPIAGRGEKSARILFEGSTVKFNCQSGFILEGQAKLTCLAGKNWSAPIPSCKRTITCKPEVLPNAEAKATKKIQLPGYSPMDKITYTCNNGYRIDDFENQQTVTCLSNGKWNVGKLEKCAIVTCFPPKKTFKMRITPEKEMYEFNEQVLFRCEEGFQVKGTSLLTCGEDGDWDMWSPKCEVIRCSDPGRPESGRRIGNSFLVGENVTFVCSDGYLLQGSETRTCLPTREWSGELTICDSQTSDCPNPGIPIGSTKEGSDYNFGGSVTYTCDGKDFIQVGNTTRFCLVNGEWSGTDNFCRYKHSFDDPTKAGLIFSEQLDVLSLSTRDSKVGGYFRENISLPVENSTFNSNARALDFSNKFGLDLYLVMDISASIDNESMAIMKEFCKEIVNKVGASSRKDGTRIFLISFSNVVNVIYKGTDEQTPEIINAEIDKLQAPEDGATALNSALKAVYQTVLTRKFKNDELSSAAIVLTDGMYNLLGDPGPTAELLKELDVDMYVIGIGSDVDKKLLKSIAKEEQYIRLETMESLKEIISMVVNNDTERYSECGLGGLNDVKYETITKYQEDKDIKHWPWMAGLYYKKIEKFQFSCGASIINRDWLLSAAHCFDTKEKMDVRNWEVRLGSSKQGTENTKSITMYMSKIIRHPDYTNSPHELHDLVLIRLQRSIIFIPTIRPICLPHDKEQFSVANFHGDWYQDNERVIVTGWGTTQARKENSQDLTHMSEILHYIAMPIQSNDTCTNSVPDDKKLKYEGLYCAGDGDQLDSCKGDSGGPSVREIKLKDGSKRIFQVGIVSFGWGCKQDGQYGFYVNVGYYLDWIRSVSESDGE